MPHPHFGCRYTAQKDMVCLYFVKILWVYADEEGPTALQIGQNAASSSSADTALLTGSANYVFYDADEAANQKKQKKKGKGKKE